MKIKYGIKNVKYSKLTYSNGTEVYGAYVAMPGAKSIALSPNGETMTEYGDDGVWYEKSMNNGYNGNLVLQGLPESFLIDILGQTKDTDGVLFESGDDQVSEFALAGEFTYDGDASLTGKRFCFFRCIPTRPNMNGTGKTNAITVDTDDLPIQCLPRISDSMVKATAENTTTGYTTFFDQVVTKKP